MMTLTRKGDYAVRGMLYLAGQPEESVSLVADMAAAVGVPQPFMAKIMQGFVKRGLVRSARGVGGGFTLALSPGKITLRDVVEAVEGPIMPNSCLLKKGTCERDGDCRVHKVWRKVQQSMEELLDGVTIEELARK
jgi:Rrf2 family protein